MINHLFYTNFITWLGSCLTKKVRWLLAWCCKVYLVLSIGRGWWSWRTSTYIWSGKRRQRNANVFLHLTAVLKPLNSEWSFVPSVKKLKVQRTASLTNSIWRNRHCPQKTGQQSPVPGDWGRSHCCCLSRPRQAHMGTSDVLHGKTWLQQLAHGRAVVFNKAEGRFWTHLCKWA